ncbi:MAG TPA: hypothetical protein VFM18_01860 [Methanosarcina sp.]|nr:hypothetical protein [Methanosarcina sp.]
MRIKVINVDIEQKDNGKGRTYEIAEILYQAGDRKSEFKMLSFSNPAGFKMIKDAKKGDEFDVTVTKNDAGYNQWADVKPAGAGPTEIGGSTPVSDSKPKSFGGVQGRDYETKEERQQRQVLIVRQSSLTNAISVLTTGVKAPPDPEAVKKLAQEFVDFVFGNDAKFENVEQPTGLLDMEDDIPY